MYKDCKCQTIDGPLIISKANFRPGTGRPPFYFGSPFWAVRILPLKFLIVYQRKF